MDLVVIDALDRAAKALDAASAAVALNRGEYEALGDMMSMWLMDEAEAVRSLLESMNKDGRSFAARTGPLQVLPEQVGADALIAQAVPPRIGPLGQPVNAAPDIDDPAREVPVADHAVGAAVSCAGRH